MVGMPRTAVMLITMSFRISVGSRGAINTFLISREGVLDTTFATAMDPRPGLSASAAFVLIRLYGLTAIPSFGCLWCHGALRDLFVISASD